MASNNKRVLTASRGGVAQDERQGGEAPGLDGQQAGQRAWLPLHPAGRSHQVSTISAQFGVISELSVKGTRVVIRVYSVLNPVAPPQKHGGMK